MKKFFSTLIVILFILTSVFSINAVSMFPYPKFHGQTSSGAPLSGGLLYTYSPGTSTPKTTYTDSAGTTPNSNPVVLDANGDAMVYLDGVYDLVLKNAAGTVIWTLSSVSGVNSITTSSSVSEWISQDLTGLTYVGGTQFSAIGDLRTTFPDNGRIKATVTAGTIYATVSSTVYAAGRTTVTVVNDTGALDSGLSAIWTGLLAPTNTSLPSTLTLPVGTILPYAGSTAPAGWLLCYGQSLSTTTYAALYTVLSTTYGGGGATFNVPDLRGRIIVGPDNMGGSAASRVAAAIAPGITGGLETAVAHSHTTGDHTLTEAEMPAHTHSQVGVGQVGRQDGGEPTAGAGSAATGSAGSSTAHNHGQTGSGGTVAIMNPYITINYIIKY